MGFSLSIFLEHNRDLIITEWTKGVQTRIGDSYAGRARQEIIGTVTEAYEANRHVLLHNDYSYINRFVEKITKMRLSAGFSLSDVQMAFELFRTVTVPILAGETDVKAFADTITRINQCLTYTIHRFSDLFQSMHQAKILEHNQRLEEVVRTRTAALEESERKYKTLVEEINDGYFVVQNDVVVFANPAFAQMHGYEPFEIKGKKFHTFLDPVSRKKIAGDYRKALQKQGTPVVLEYLRMTREGKSYPTEILAKTTKYDNKTSSIGICRDITERVLMEKKIRESERMAYIGQIATSLSHEIRNPLSSVQMNLQILKKNPLFKGNDQKRIDISIREVRRLENILKELLDFAKPIQLRFESDSLNRCLLAAVELLEMKVKEEKITMTTDLDNRLPAIPIDKQKIEQVLINLMLNALEVSSPGDHIFIQSRYIKENMAMAVISDEGCGVPEAQRDDIFKPFFTTKNRGTGLGLSNVKRIVEAHKGRVEVENRRPRGASFKIFIPA